MKFKNWLKKLLKKGISIIIFKKKAFNKNMKLKVKIYKWKKNKWKIIKKYTSK